MGNLYFIKVFTHNKPTKVDFKRVVSLLFRGRRVFFRQPCNCSTIRHFTGGNYHFSAILKLLDGEIFVLWRTTAEIELPWFVDFEVINVKELPDFITRLENAGFELEN